MTTTCECGNAKTKRAQKCKSCACREAGRKGYAATVARYGEKFAVKHVQAHRLAHPSSLEVKVMAILDNLGLEYSREVWFETKASGKAKRVYLVDFVVHLDGNDYPIEVQGGWAHSFHTERDARKLRLLRSRGYRVLELHEATIKAGRAEVEILVHLGLVLELSIPSMVLR